MGRRISSGITLQVDMRPVCAMICAVYTRLYMDTLATDRPIIVFIGNTTTNPIRRRSSIRDTYSLVLVRDDKPADEKEQRSFEYFDEVLSCDLSSPEHVIEQLQPYRDLIAAVSSRSEYLLDQVAEVIRFLPEGLYTPDPDALQCANNKRDMKAAFTAYSTCITPAYRCVEGPSDQRLLEARNTLSFPVILKPVNLAGSSMIRQVTTPEELSSAVAAMKRDLTHYAQRFRRTPDPEIMIEEFVSGDMYTLDGYADENGILTPCPLVAMVTGDEQRGGGFHTQYTYTPVDIDESSIQEARRTAQEATNAVGLTNTPIQFDLVHGTSGWQVIELGARLGASRRKQYWLTYGFDHGTNDVRLRLGEEPVVVHEPKGVCVNKKFYVEEDGICTSIEGVDAIKNLPSCNTMHVKVEEGGEVWSHQHGGEFIARLTLFHQDAEQVWHDLEKAESAFSVVCTAPATSVVSSH